MNTEVSLLDIELSDQLVKVYAIVDDRDDPMIAEVKAELARVRARMVHDIRELNSHSVNYLVSKGLTQIVGLLAHKAEVFADLNREALKLAEGEENLDQVTNLAERLYRLGEELKLLTKWEADKLVEREEKDSEVYEKDLQVARLVLAKKSEKFAVYVGERRFCYSQEEGMPKLLLKALRELGKKNDK